jgi:mRNA-degrading endonuclease RelE of RelBE toxin-antitoxin system
MPRKLTFGEALDFTAVVYDYFGSDTELAAFQEALLANPERGDVMPGCGGLRKAGWRDTRRGKGARGGLRIIYLFVPDADRVLLLDVYDKNEADDLTPDGKRLLASLAHAYREEARRSVERKGF